MTDLHRDIAEELDGFRHVLKPAQERVLAEVAGRGDEEFTRAEYESLAHVSRSQAAYDLADLVKLGLVERLGSGRATRYRVARAGGGRRRKWTPERIHTELKAFCDEQGGWPRAAEFKDSGRGDLYLAASRYGGIDYWADELGFVEPNLPEPSVSGLRADASERRRRTGLVGAGLATIAAVAFLGLLFVDGDRPAREQVLALSPVRAVPDAAGRPAADRGGAPEAQAVAFRLLAARGDSWLAIRRDSADGRLLWEGILERGEALRFRGPLWLRFGAPGSLVALLNGDRAALPPRTETARVTAAGIRILQLARPTVLAAADDGGSELVSQAATSSPPPQTGASPSRGGGPAPDPAPSPNPGPSPDPPPGD